MSLQPGDIFIQGYEPKVNGPGVDGIHALMWIGGDKPLVHSSNDKSLGVLAQTMSYFEKFITKNEVETPVGAAVFRYRGNINGLAAKAADYASKWATRSDAVSEEGSKFAQRVLGTPFSAKRLGASYARRAAFEQSAKPVGVETIFRVLKAIARTELGSKLSPNHGVSCSQFVVYCYQAASLKIKFNDAIPPQVLNSFKGEKKQQEGYSLQRYVKEELGNDWEANTYWRDKAWEAEQGIFRKAKDLAHDDASISLLNTALTHDQTADFYKNLLPPGMNIDPLSYGVVFLQQQFTKPDSPFEYAGHLFGKRDSTGNKPVVTWTLKKI